MYIYIYIYIYNIYIYIYVCLSSYPNPVYCVRRFSLRWRRLVYAGGACDSISLMNPFRYTYVYLHTHIRIGVHPGFNIEG